MSHQHDHDHDHDCGHDHDCDHGAIEIAFELIDGALERFQLTDDDVSQALNAARHYKMEGKRLALFDDRGTFLADFVASK